jgi:hypothetical protein
MHGLEKRINQRNPYQAGFAPKNATITLMPNASMLQQAKTRLVDILSLFKPKRREALLNTALAEEDIPKLPFSD